MIYFVIVFTLFVGNQLVNKDPSHVEKSHKEYKNNNRRINEKV